MFPDPSYHPKAKKIYLSTKSGEACPQPKPDSLFIANQ